MSPSVYIFSIDYSIARAESQGIGEQKKTKKRFLYILSIRRLQNVDKRCKICYFRIDFLMKEMIDCEDEAEPAHALRIL